jgi:hypothetical protein
MLANMHQPDSDIESKLMLHPSRKNILYFYCNTNLYISTTVVLTYKLVLQYVSKHFVMSSFTFFNFKFQYSSNPVISYFFVLWVLLY